MSPIRQLWYATRSALFYLGYATITVFWGTLSLLFGWALPYEKRFAFVVGTWTFLILKWLHITCGISYQVQGLANRPDEPCVVLCRHESTWETYMLQQLFAPQATLIKRELLAIPFFGWAFSMLKPIAINRGSPRKALRELISKGRARLDQGIWVALFPEGTRLAHNAEGAFRPGGAALASASGRPVLVVAHNSGCFWPARQFTKYPGVIQVHLAEPFATTGLDTKTINQRAQTVLKELMAKVDQAAG